MRTMTILLVAMAVALIAAGAFLYSGIYDIGADAQHWPVTARALATLRERSIEARANRIEPPGLNNVELVAAGAKHYAAMCADCHRAPGVAESEMRSGLYPQPPDLTKGEAPDSGKAFWAIKHGIKMSGMPAWGASHRDGAIWELVAFITELPRLSPAEYQDLSEPTGGECGHHDPEDSPTHDEAKRHEEDPL